MTQNESKLLNTTPSIQGLYVITSPKHTTPQKLLNAVEQALLGGAKIVQYRNKNANYPQQLAMALQLKQLCNTYQAWLIINDHIQLAKESQADGLHIGKDDTQLTQAREILGSNAIIGVSCYNDLKRAIQMQALGANYVAFGRFFPSNTKPDAPQADLATLKQAKKMLHIPIVAIGGVTHENTCQLIECGADCVAVIEGVFQQADIQQAAHNISQQFAL